MTNFSRYIDSIIAHVPDTFKNQYGYQCVSGAKAIADHLGFPITSYGNAWDLYLKGSTGYSKKSPGSYIPLPGDLIFMKKSPANGNAGHIAIADEGCTLTNFMIIEQNYGIQGLSGSGVGDRHIQRRTRLASKFQGILARNIPFLIKNV